MQRSFLSCEPLLGPIDFTRTTAVGRLDWLIVGGESGPGARPMELDWARDLIARCRAAGVAVFVKLGAVWARQHGADPKGGDPDRWPHDLRVGHYPAHGARP